MKFSEFFQIATGKPPFPYQERLACADKLPLVLNVPTGSGKTATVVLGWLWRRQHDRDRTPRRLVYCLPMRSLVEQTERSIHKWLDHLKGRNALDEDIKDIEVHKLMGGSVSHDWDDRLDRNTILVGTQDQLLSRALNRGYAMSRYRWPVHFAQLNNDCFWVIDETQLMGAGLRTTAQLQWLREHFSTYGTARTLWMSATLDSDILKTVDYRQTYGNLDRPFTLGEDDREHPTLQKRLSASKSIQRTAIVVPSKGGDKEVRQYARKLTSTIAEVHRADTLTLIVCNRVDRARAVYRELQQLQRKGEIDAEIGLIHSRFRAGDRQTLGARYLDDEHPFRGILVATQVVEAGVDISATTLFTELCPWSSFVQRLGRCNRYGEATEAAVYWIDFDKKVDDKATSPYRAEAIEQARYLVGQLQEQQGNAGIESLQTFLENLPDDKRSPQALEGMVLRRHDLMQLFDTASDLAGHDIDISPFVREAQDNNVEIAWRDWGKGNPSADWGDENYVGKLYRDELCRVSMAQAQQFLKQREAWTFDAPNKQWRKVAHNELFPGITLLVRTTDGGYSSELGFTGGKEKDFAPLDLPEDGDFNSDRDDPLSQVGTYITLEQHARDTFNEAQKLCEALKLSDLPVESIARAARYHDAGKAHEEFQKMLTWNREERKGATLWAKSDRDFKNSSDRPPRKFQDRGFRYLRHEWASALLALQQGEPFLLAYLVACHHGKVRMVVQPYPNEKAAPHGKAYARGVWDGDTLPEIDLGDGLTIPSCQLSLDCVALGENSDGEPSWVARSLDLLDEYGAFKLAYLETVVRVADWRASARYTGPLAEE
ncbi:type I-G CRISPR-associated helicase/endonuclease Cas3g [Oxynema aestuarii]|uniref:CRISPR-associated helicase Cas3 n=1 Tax=Oxynema aestuarii AP17 TaxID=2064643 RepID=A0A6H1U2W3_9CYAN|nr:CRISPR-associated helicase Cas3' [Oxynema aestuarii]QIZ71959.1 CRISPR-associated helicase Cas3' [Oxynema aestuarii AP17]